MTELIASTELASLRDRFDTFAHLESHTWRTQRVTPLHSFRFADRQSYTLRLQSFVGSRVKCDEANVSAMVVRVRGAPADAAVLLFAIVVARPEGKVQAVCTVLSTIGSGVMFDFDTTASRSSAAANFVPTRVGMQRGDSKLGAIVFEWLSASFDCNIEPLSFPPYLLVAVANDWLSGSQKRPLELAYAAPAHAAANGLEQLSLAVPFETVEALRFVTKATSYDVQQNGEKLLAALEAHVSGVTHIQLGSFRLERISCSIGTLGSDGRLKIQPGFVESALRTLSQFVVHNALLKPQLALPSTGKRRRRPDENTSEQQQLAPQARGEDVDDDGEEQDE